LDRRMVEIRDAQRELRRWMSPKTEQHVRQLTRTAQLDNETSDAIVAATVLLDAAQRYQDGCAPTNEPILAPGATDTAPEAERAHLLLVSKCLRHPLVASAVASR
ncbi:DUF6545 domain-containing protein, partial [Wenjunlia tyrosinilytica]|uniref:DUF6545 domain-containing protein n=1 Tax=Wenjunlia tyrosinilytica TaxID=1544741 RepID=UPI003570D0F0